MDQATGEPEVKPGAESGVQSGAESGVQSGAEPSTEPTGAESNIEPDAESRMRLNAEPSAELNVEPSLSSAQVRKVSEGKPEKPKHRCKRLLIICGILVVVAVVILISLTIVGSKKPKSPNNYRPNSLNNYRPNSPEDIMVRYLHDKYGKDFKLVGEMTHNSASSVVGGYYASDAHPVDNPRIRFEVVLDGGNVERKYKKSDDYIEASRTVLEEDRLRPYIERIFGKDAEFGVRFDLCKIDGDTPKSFADLYRAMRICKERTAGMTRDQVVYSDDGLAHDYSLYIYDPDGQSIETDSDKTKIIERLREMAKYLPDGRLSAMSLRYYIKEGDRELEISASGLLASQSTSQLVYGFDKKVSKVIDTAKKCGPPPYPRERGWHLDKKERTKEQTKSRGGCGNVSK
ncbi:hypothetical protein [Candidatus Nanoperiomorbus periodonticus]|uniref:hypothetical protein n=1 Tax=Candidatus Nanoperiomorbus periodonticus TaxID=2171989 RepID=UPI00101B70E8|nr:hypothetical protein [Candidatus Nanoperiomorbus periodonticus]RYC75911.1 hypothetical protein G52EAM_00156 [Candidatus Nanoperiomorbus periodonticus]